MVLGVIIQYYNIKQSKIVSYQTFKRVEKDKAKWNENLRRALFLLKRRSHCKFSYFFSIFFVLQKSLWQVLLEVSQTILLEFQYSAITSTEHIKQNKTLVKDFMKNVSNILFFQHKNKIV